MTIKRLKWVGEKPMMNHAVDPTEVAAQEMVEKIHKLVSADLKVKLSEIAEAWMCAQYFAWTLEQAVCGVGAGFAHR